MVAANVPLRVPKPAPKAPPQRPAPQQQHSPAFPAPMAYSLGRPLDRSPSSGPARDASYGPAAKGALSYGRFAQVTSGHVDPSWLDLLHHWWERHAYYPQEAIANGEDGTVGIRIVVNRYGRVESVEQLQRSGSKWLDIAAEGVFRGAQVPPLPPDTKDKTITINLAITYVLLRR